MPTFAQEMAELMALIDKGIALYSQARIASIERQAEIRTELERIVREIIKIKLRNGN